MSQQSLHTFLECSQMMIARFLPCCLYAALAFSDTRSVDPISLTLHSPQFCASVTAHRLNTPEARQIGFSGEPAKIRALLFVWNRPTQRNFWMKNTHIPIVLFRLSNSGRVQHVSLLTPNDATIHEDPLQGQFALEVRLDGLTPQEITQLKSIDQVSGASFSSAHRPATPCTSYSSNLF